MADITKTNVEYQFYQPTWKLIRNLMKGERALKLNDFQRISSGVQQSNTPNLSYIPQINPTDTSPKNQARNIQYIERASLFNFTKRTCSGMLGMVFQKEAILNLPEGFEYLKHNADGSGLGIVQQAKQVLTDIIETGNSGLFVDFPETSGAVSAEAAKKITAKIIEYKAESIVDWRCEMIDGNKKLTFVKLMEYVTEVDENDFFCSVEVIQYRLLILDDQGFYVQKLFDEKGNQIGEDINPTNSIGARFDYIPFYFVGSVNNAAGIDPAPLAEIAELNVKHYRNSADWEESCFLVGQPTPVFAGLTAQWVKDVFTDGEVHLGSRNAVPLPAGGSAMLLQASPNQMPMEGMKHKEEQAVALGARLITPQGQAETAEAVMIKHSSDASVLKTIVQNINEGYEMALKTVQEFQGITSEEIEFDLNTEFITDSMTSDQITALVSAWQSGVISKDVLDRKLVKGGVIDEGIDLERMNEEISQGTIGLDLGE